MATISTGVFPVSALKIEIGISKAASDWTYAEIADMESANITVDTGVEEWNSITEGGWRKALATAKSLSMSMSGKRCLGDEGNDYVANMWNKNGQDCNSSCKITVPNGDTLVFDCVVQVTSFLGSDATAVAPLEFELLSNGEPVYTAQ